MISAFHPKSIPRSPFGRAHIRRTLISAILILCALMCWVPAGAKTLERFNLSAGVGGTLSVPNLWIGEALGNGFIFLGPGVDLFENRFSLQLDLGVSNALFNSKTYDFGFREYKPYRDTLFRTESDYEYRKNETRILASYTGALNFDKWSFYAGSLVLMRLIEVDRKGMQYRSFALGDTLDRFEWLDQKPIDERYRFGMGNILALYGSARRFGRISMFVQGVALISIQGGIRVSLRPLGKVGSHRGP